MTLGGDLNLRFEDTDEEAKDNEESELDMEFPQLKIIREDINEQQLVELFKLLIRNGLDLNYHSNVPDFTLINKAIFNGFVGLVDVFMKNNVDLCPVPFPIRSVKKTDSNGREFWFWIDISDKFEVPAITNAAIKDNFRTLSLFIDRSLQKYDFFDFKYCNPVCVAIKTANLDLLKFLLNKGFRYFKCSHFKNILITSPETLDLFLNIDYLKSSQFPFDIIYEAARYYTCQKQEDLAIKLIEILKEL